MAAGSYAFTATDTTSAGTSAASNALDVTVPGASPPPSGTNLVANGNFATGDFTNWTLGGNDSNTPAPQLYIDTTAQGGSTYAAAIGSMGADGTLSQTIATTAGQTYTLSFWLQNEGSTGNDFKAIWNGQTLLSLTNAAQFGYTEYTYTVTATSSTTTLEFSAANIPSNWDLDNISLTANGTSTTTPPAAPVISSGVANSNESVTLTGTAPAGSTVTVSDGGTTALGTATANSTTGAWTYTTAALSAGSYAFTATDTTSAGTSAASSAFDVTVTSSSPPPSGPTVSSIVDSPASGDLDAGKTVTLTLKMSDNVTVNTTHGTPTLTLNDGGTATYTSGSGSNALTFSYTVGAGDKNVTSLAATTINLNGATIQDGSGNAANLSLTGLTQTGPQIDTSTPTVSSIAESPSSGDLNAGKTVTYSIAMSEKVTVSGTPQLMLNDGGTASYTSGTGTSTLTFVYTVAAGQNTPDLMVTGVNLNGGSITDGAGNAANLSLTGVAQGSPAIDTTPPTVSSVLESPASGNLNAGNKVTLTLDMSENVTVNTAHGKPTLTLNDGGTATYTGGSGTSALTFSYTVVNGQNTAALAATAINLNGATLQDGAGNAANLSLTGLTQTGPQIVTSAPVVTATNQTVADGQSIPLSSIYSVSGSGITEYRVWFSWPQEGDPAYGMVTNNGTPIAADQWVTVSSLSGLAFVGSATSGTDYIWLQAYNGSWNSPSTEAIITDAGLAAPVVTATNQTIADGQSIPLSSIYSVSGSGITEYRVWFSWPQAGDPAYGMVTNNGTPIAADQWVTVSSLSGLAFVGSATPGTDHIWLQAYNGSWNSPSTEAIITDAGLAAPVVTATNQTIADGQSIPLSSIYSVSGSGITEYRVWFSWPQAGDPAYGMVTNNGTPIAADQWVTVSSLSGLAFVGSATSGTDYIWLQAYNGSWNSPSTEAIITDGPPGSTTVGAGATLQIAGADTGSVTFAASTGMLKLDTPSTFTGKISNFTGNGTLSGSDQIDLTNINFSTVKDSYANGVLTVSDGNGDTAKLSFNGSYTLANFDFASDGSGGTIVYDPPVSTSDSQNTNAPPPNTTSTGASGSATIGTGATLELAAANSGSVASTGSKGTFIPDGTSLPERAFNWATTVSGPGAQNVIDLPDIAFGAQTTLGYLSDSDWAGGTMSVADGTHNANIALLGNYMASSFAMASEGHGGTLVAAEAAQPDQSLLSSPHHA